MTFAACSHVSTGTAVDALVADGTIDADDGSATRESCTSKFGDGLSADPTFGRLDGFLVAIVPPANMQSCNDDQSPRSSAKVRMSGMTYDVAIDVTDAATMVDDVHTTTRDIAMPGATPWSEGWHTGSDVLDDYVSLGVHDSDLALEAKADLVQLLQTDLATANHVSVYTTSYGSDGAHLVHRNGSGHDGILVTEPLSTPAHLRFFSFTTSRSEDTGVNGTPGR